MPQALTFKDVVMEEAGEPASFSAPAGSLLALITSRQDDSDRLVRLLLGLARPAAGSVTTLGQELAFASGKDLERLRGRVAVVHPAGGLISNLKVWENLVLPLEYHGALSPAQIEERGRRVLRRVGYSGSPMELPGHLTLYQKRLVGLARAMLIEPELIVYNAVLAGLREDERTAMLSAIWEFHREEQGRSSLFITSNLELVADLPFEGRIFLKGSPHDT